MEVILWQFTVRGEHPVAAVALRELLWLLEERHKAVIRGLYFAVPTDVYGQWKSRQRQKSDESIDFKANAARSAIKEARQAQPDVQRGPGRPPKRELEVTVLHAAVSALDRIQQFAVEIPATGASKRL